MELVRAYLVEQREPRSSAEVDTALGALPKLLGPGSTPCDLRFTGPDGRRHERAHLIQISNNPYGSKAGAMGSRPRLDTGALQVISLVLGRDAAAFFAAVAVGHPERFQGFASWTAPTFEVSSGGPIDVGLDGEAIQMDPPLRFSIHPDQVPVINAAFTPSEEEVARARAIVNVLSANPGAGALSLDGQMVDQPHLEQARRLLERLR